MAYTKVFERPYSGGWVDYPSETTLITADALNEYDETFQHVEDYLEDNPISQKAEQSTISDAYNAATTYAAGDHFIYNDVIYTVNVACTGITPPNANYYTANNLTDLIEANSSQISDLASYTSLLTTSPTAWVNSTTEITLNEDLTDYSRITINGYIDTNAGGRRFSISCDLNALRLASGLFSIGVVVTTLLRVPIAVNAWCRNEKLRIEFLDVSTGSSISNTVYISSILGYK